MLTKRKSTGLGNAGSVRELPLPLAGPPTLPLDVLGPVTCIFPLTVAAVIVPAAPGLIANVPGLAAQSLGFEKLLKKFCNTSRCVGLGPLPSI